MNARSLTLHAASSCVPVVLAQFLEGAGVKAVICNSPTAEASALSLEERQRLLSFCRRRFSGSIINHVSSPALLDVRQLLAHSAATLWKQGEKEQATKTTVADAVLLQAPHSYSAVDEAGSEVSCHEIVYSYYCFAC